MPAHRTDEVTETLGLWTSRIVRGKIRFIDFWENFFTESRSILLMYFNTVWPQFSLEIKQSVAYFNPGTPENKVNHRS